MIAAGKLKEVADIGKSISEHKKELFAAHKTFFRWLKHHGHEIIIVGAGGCGKTTLGHMLGGKSFFDPNLSVFNESMNVEEFKRPGEGIYKIRVMPGQKRRRDLIWPNVMEGLAQGAPLG